MGKDVADLSLAYLGCTPPGTDTWAVLHLEDDEVVSRQGITAAQAASLKEEAQVSGPAFATEASGTVDAWSGWNAAKRQALYRSCRDQ